MAKRKSTRTAREQTTRPVPLAHPNIGFIRFWVPSMTMREIAKAQSSEEPPLGGYPIQFSVGARVTTANATQAKVGHLFLDFSLKGDPRDKPYELQLQIVGEFAMRDGSHEDLATFCREVGPTLLFPYVRQIVDRMTSDGQHGSVRISPLNIRAMLGPESWTKQDDRPAPDPIQSPSPREPRQRD